MTKDKPLIKLSKDGSKHVTDEFYNVLTSSIAAIIYFFGSIYLVYQSYQLQKLGHVVSFSIYGFGVLCVFVTSALHHKIDSTEKIELLLKQLDYFSISIMIAGTFTPLCTILVKGTFGLKILGVVWVLAILGIGLKAAFPHIPKWITTSLFLIMGWMGVLIFRPVYAQLHWDGLQWLVYGGLFFSVGALIYTFERPNPFPGRFGFHEIWHVFVICGAGCHFYMMAAYVLWL